MDKKIKEAIEILIEHSLRDMNRKNGTYRKLYSTELDEKEIRKAKKAIKYLGYLMSAE